jgi:hypothetical protein
MIFMILFLSVNASQEQDKTLGGGFDIVPETFIEPETEVATDDVKLRETLCEKSVVCTVFKKPCGGPMKPVDKFPIQHKLDDSLSNGCALPSPYMEFMKKDEVDQCCFTMNVNYWPMACPSGNLEDICQDFNVDNDGYEIFMHRIVDIKFVKKLPGEAPPMSDVQETTVTYDTKTVESDPAATLVTSESQIPGDSSSQSSESSSPPLLPSKPSSSSLTLDSFTTKSLTIGLPLHYSVQPLLKTPRIILLVYFFVIGISALSYAYVLAISSENRLILEGKLVEHNYMQGSTTHHGETSDSDDHSIESSLSSGFEEGLDLEQGMHTVSLDEPIIGSPSRQATRPQISPEIDALLSDAAAAT